MRQACNRFEASSRRFTRGVDNVDAALILSASEALNEGNALVEEANVELESVLG